jgi:hypothetical protein
MLRASFAIGMLHVVACAEAPPPPEYAAGLDLAISFLVGNPRQRNVREADAKRRRSIRLTLKTAARPR